MNRRTFLKTVPAFTVLATGASRLARAAEPTATAAQDAGTSSGAAQEIAAGSSSTQTAAASRPALDLPPITLLKPQTDGGKSVLAALWARRTIRNIADKPLPPQMLSNLIWAAWGVNRPAGQSGRLGRTAASASNSQEIDLYIVLPEGIYLYEAVPHRLIPVVAGDQRSNVGRGGRRSSMARAPVILISVVDLAKYNRGRPQEPGLRDPEIQKSYYNVATGLIAGNVYLFAASQDLAAWFHNCNRTGLATLMGLRQDQRVLYAQTVGYPAE